MSRVRPAHAAAVGAAAYLLWSACGQSGYTSTPSPPDPRPFRITITNSGVIPAAVTVTQRSVVEFLNVSDDTHDIRSDPHPAHTGCPEFNLVSAIPPGNSVAILTPIEKGRSCKYHDETRPTDSRFQGSFVVD